MQSGMVVEKDFEKRKNSWSATKLFIFGHKESLVVDHEEIFQN